MTNRLQTIAQAAKKIALSKQSEPVLTDKDLSVILQSEYAVKRADYSEQRNELDFN